MRKGMRTPKIVQGVDEQRPNRTPDIVQPGANRPGGNGGVVQMPGRPEPGQQINPAGNTIIQPALQHDIGGVSQVPNVWGGVDFLYLEFDNSAGAAPVQYRIGSEVGAGLAGLAGLPIATGGSNDPASIYSLFAVAAFYTGAIKYVTSSDERQFDQEFTYYRGNDVSGQNNGSKPIPFQLASRPTFENDLELWIQTTENMYRLGQMEQMTITVLAGEIVGLTLVPGLLGGRS